MTPEERELIEGVFERMRSVGAVDKDREAEALINTSVRQIRDSAYMLVQTVVVQGQALEQSELRMQELEQQVADLEAQLQQQQQPQQRPSGGGFLGGIFGGSKQAAPARDESPWGGSVPQAGRQSAGYGGPRQQSASPWNSGQLEPRGGGFNQQPMQQAPAAAGGGGFMRSALTTAAGVAGGVLVAGAIGNMMRGNPSEGGSTHNSSADGNSSLPGYQDASSNDQGGTYSSEPQYQDAASNDQGSYSEAEDASYDDGGSDWGGDIET